METKDRTQAPATGSGIVRIRTFEPMSRRRFGLTAAAAAIGLGAAARPWRAAAATDIAYMGWQGYDDAISAGDFLKKNGLVLQTTYMESQEQWITAMKGGSRGNLDVGTPVDFYVPFTSKAGLLAPLDTAKIPNLERVFPQFRSSDNLNVDGKMYAVPLTWGSLPLMYNADVVKEKPTSWWELLNPAYKKRAAVVEDSIGVMMIFCRMANKTMTPWFCTPEMRDKTVELMIKFKKEQALTICASYGDLAQLLGSGEVVIAQGWEPVSTWTGEHSPPIKWAYPKEGTTNFVDTYAIFADAPHMEIDHQILNQVLSVEAQVQNAEKNAAAVTNMDAVAKLSAKAKGLYPYDDVASFFKETGGPTRMFPMDKGGQYLAYDELLKGWEQFLKA
jgi:spermidine/putrescine-binding protein